MINEAQMETEDQAEDVKPFLPQTITQKSEDDEKADSGNHSMSSDSNESLWMENNVESSVIAKDDVEDNCRISQSQINEDNWNLMLEHESVMGDETEKLSAENSSDVNETAKIPAKPFSSKESVEVTTKWQCVLVKFMKEYYPKHPKATLIELTSAMKKELELPWKGPTLLKYVGLMIYKYREILKEIDLGNCNMEDDKEFVYKRCPYFHEMHEALQFSEFYRKVGNRRVRKMHKNLQARVRSSIRKKLQLKLKSNNENKMETAEKPQGDGESESGTVSISSDTSTDDNLDSSKTARESESESPMDEGSCKHSGNDELESNTSEENEVDSEPSNDESSSGSSKSSEDEAEENVARTRIWNKTRKNCTTKSTEDNDQLNYEKSTDKKCISSEKKMKKGRKLMSTIQTQKNQMKRNTLELCSSLAIFMKEYYKKNPSSFRTQMIQAFRKESKSNLHVETLLKHVQRMIKSYRQLRWEFDNLKSCANRKKMISEHCPYYDDIHEAYEYSDICRNSKWKPDAQSQNILKSSTSNTSKSSKDNKNEKCLGCVRVKIEPIESSKPKAVKSKLVKTRTRLSTSTTKTVDKLDKSMRNPLKWTPELEIKMARYMRDYYKKDPKVTQATLQKILYKHFNLKCNVGGFKFRIENMVRTYRVLRHRLGNPDTYSSSLKKELRSKRCPYFFEIHEAYQYSDYYRNCNWTPKTKEDPKLWMTSYLQPTTSNALSDDEMETADETTDCPTSPKHATRSSSKRKNNTSRDRDLERSVIGKEAAIRIPLLKMQDNDSEEEVVEAPLLQLQDCDHKQESSNVPVEEAKATAKTQVTIDELKLNSEHQLELIKLEDRKEERMDRKEERQFQMQFTKLQQEHEIMQQKYEIRKLKLQIEYERAKNLKQ